MKGNYVMFKFDKFYDDALNVSTILEENESPTGREAFFDYVPTSYFFLEKLFKHFPFRTEDHLIDFGCGKGRVLFMAAINSCECVTGYEINEERYTSLVKNINNYQEKFGRKTVFYTYKDDAQNIEIDTIETANKFFFFNPFHLKIYIKVVNKVMISLKNNPRNIAVFLYQPHVKTIEYFDTINVFHKEAFVQYSFISPQINKIHIPQFAVYSNYSMEHPLNEYSISL